MPPEWDWLSITAVPVHPAWDGIENKNILVWHFDCIPGASNQKDVRYHSHEKTDIK